ncbi:hypothetical protein [Nostoc sp. 'Peltigera membranacea cyanobiont' 213]|uniref:hypothetical protein n=1 Tax=Nostoc sp. 'Peltigera membranacea cyanobiont' 213 TaxID=2014530 RepID=UPI00167E6BBC|nr:hypothetical protein [Nostoc sp. 'Peltigera membranacea cyanobiont' 213]
MSIQTISLTLFYYFRKNKIFVGWVEQRKTQQKQGLLALGFVPQPNLPIDL